MRVPLMLFLTATALNGCRPAQLHAQRIDPERVPSTEVLREALNGLAGSICSDSSQHLTILPRQYGYDGEPNGTGRAPEVPRIPEELLVSFHETATRRCEATRNSGESSSVGLVGLAIREDARAVYVWLLQHNGVINGIIRFSVVRTEMRRVNESWQPVATVFVTGS
jgi:hypothetical protein